MNMTDIRYHHSWEFLHAIPEEEFEMSKVTITDVTFLGLFPKKKISNIAQI
jgi:hypothetical protein